MRDNHGRQINHVSGGVIEHLISQGGAKFHSSWAGQIDAISNIPITNLIGNSGYLP